MYKGRLHSCKSVHWSLLLVVLAALHTSLVTAAPARIALVIGNADYVDGKLKNPVNDAVLMTHTLESKGFQVTTLKNGTRRQMKVAIREFTRSLDRQSVGLFYFAGHGIEFNGSNYLIPVDADIVGEEDVEYESINAGRLLGGLELSNNGLNLVILDACRNNPYSRSFRSSTRGLSRMQPASGSLIMYATEPGDVAADGAGNNGVFTTHLVNAINQQGKKIEEVFKITAISVNRATGKKQTPYIEGVVLGDFYFSGAAKAESAPAQAPVISSDGSGENERLFWNSVTADPSREMYEAYLEQYPNGNYAILAKIKAASDETHWAGVDISGDYNSRTTGSTRYFTHIYKNPIVRIKQDGNLISGTFGEIISGVFHGEIEGDIAKIKWGTSRGNGYAEWKIGKNGEEITGTYNSSNGRKGSWNLTKIK